MLQFPDRKVSGRRKYPQQFLHAVVSASWLAFCGIALAQEGYVGATICGSCHPTEYESQSQSNHANALHRGSSAAQLPIPAGKPGESTDTSVAQFEFRKAPADFSVTVTLGSEQKQIPIDWIFGAGDQGYTFFSRLSPRQFLEHRVSYYKRYAGFDITPGQRASTSNSLGDAIGTTLSSTEALRCLRCHSTYVKQTPDGPDFSSLVPGVGCERCHGPGTAHVKAMRSGASNHRITNPGKLSGDDLLLMCGECHRTEPPPGMPFDDPVLTRFQPVGLQLSACFQKSNGGITCTTCHNPHENAHREDDGFYNRRCSNCHNGAEQVKCKAQPAGDCVSCHMPKTTPLPYMVFTDHWIRVLGASISQIKLRSWFQELYMAAWFRRAWVNVVRKELTAVVAP
jgi:hypothetical protein